MAYDTPPPSQVPEAGYYYHYKHDPREGIDHHAYFIYGVGLYTEDECSLADRFMQVYRPLDKTSPMYVNGKIFPLRPLGMLYQPIEWNGRQVQRFTRITDPLVIARLRTIKRQMYPTHLEE